MKGFFDLGIVHTKQIDREILISLLSDKLRNIDEVNLVNILYSYVEAIFDFNALCDGGNKGVKISMLFNPHRYNTPTIQSKSIIEAFKSESFISGVTRVLLHKNQKVKDLLYQSLQLGINGIQYVNEFPPHIARDLYLYYNASTILDPCAGWGGRMIGAASIGSFYHGFEPATKTYNGLLSLGEFLKKFKTGFDFKIENLPFEDAIIKDKYDLALTSPPYYNTELYSTEETNSCNRYTTYEDWCNGFYLPMINKTLKNTKNFIINIGTRKYDLKNILMDNNIELKEIKSKLSGKGGLGKITETSEKFYLVSK